MNTPPIESAMTIQLTLGQAMTLLGTLEREEEAARRNGDCFTRTEHRELRQMLKMVNALPAVKSCVAECDARLARQMKGGR
jgi:hypothetical protein